MIIFFTEVEYNDPSGLQEKLERLNQIMSGEWEQQRRPFLNQCKFWTVLLQTWEQKEKYVKGTGEVI